MSQATIGFNLKNGALPKAATGIEGLDEITGGGLSRGRPTLHCGSAIAREASAEAVPPNLPAPAVKRRILIVDDDQDNADSLALLLEIMGNEVSTAYDGEQAIDVAEAVRPDVVLLDIGMPKMSGYEACRRMRERSWGKNAMLLALTGWGQEEDRRRTQEAGFDQHMVKPVDAADLMKLLASWPQRAGPR